MEDMYINKNRINCPMRHENGNCLPAGGFCTAVNDSICNALHNAFKHGENAEYERITLSLADKNTKYMQDSLDILKQIHEKVAAETVESDKTANYEKMWKELKEMLEKDLQFYEDGRMCSMMEAAQGSMHCGSMLKEMKDIEDKYVKPENNLRLIGVEPEDDDSLCEGCLSRDCDICPRDDFHRCYGCPCDTCKVADGKRTNWYNSYTKRHED